MCQSVLSPRQAIPLDGRMMGDAGSHACQSKPGGMGPAYLMPVNVETFPGRNPGTPCNLITPGIVGILNVYCSKRRVA